MQHGTSGRKSAPRVIDGRVQKKNNRVRDAGDYYRRRQPELVIDRLRPGDGYRHLLTVQEVRGFLALLPDWDGLSDGLQAVVLAPGEFDVDGYHCRGVVHLCAWERGLWRESPAWYYAAHRDLFERLGVVCEPQPDGSHLCCWTEGAARAYQLLHVLLHELGHHHDRITTRSGRRASRGEPYAEAYARKYEALLWDRYWRRRSR